MLLVDKPAGPTSHDVVQSARRALGTRRVGHAGTLDPFATGLLLLCVGRATRLVEVLHRLSKTYEATTVLGVETETHDPEGQVVSTSEAWKRLDRSDVERVVGTFRGRQLQRPPAFSAKRVGRRRAHQAAREGEPLRLDPVEVEVFRLDVLGLEPPQLRFRAEVSTGTYVRALARDLGRALGCGAHLDSLRRTAVGPFSVDDAASPETLEGIGRADPAWRDPASALSWLPRRRLGREEAEAIRVGRRVPRGEIEDPDRRWVADGGASLPVALLREDRLVALAELDGDALQPRKVLHRGAGDP